MLVGTHSIIYSRKPEADRAFLRDVLRLPSADAGEGWLIFGLPPGEVAVHPAEENDVHEFYLMCQDIEAFVAAMAQAGVACGEVMNRGWGLLTQVTLPGGGKLGVYEPRHARPRAMKAGRPSRRSSPGRRGPASKRRTTSRGLRKRTRR